LAWHEWGFKAASSSRIGSSPASSNSSKSSVMLLLLQLSWILIQQFTLAHLIQWLGPWQTGSWEKRRCAEELSVNPSPPFYFGDHNELILRPDLSYPVTKSTISGALLLCVLWTRNFALFPAHGVLLSSIFYSASIDIDRCSSATDVNCALCLVSRITPSKGHRMRNSEGHSTLFSLRPNASPSIAPIDGIDCCIEWPTYELWYYRKSHASIKGTRPPETSQFLC